mgnify:CR=1 FL=1
MDHPGFLDEFEHLYGFRGIASEGFCAEHIFPCCSGKLYSLEVQVVGQSYYDGIHFGIIYCLMH